MRIRDYFGIWMNTVASIMWSISLVRVLTENTIPYWGELLLAAVIAAHITLAISFIIDGIQRD